MEQQRIQITKVGKQFRDSKRGVVYAVKDLSLTIDKGETYGLVGESGCGKSTTGNMIAHLISPDEGTIAFDGQVISNLSARKFRPYRRQIQMVFQDPYSSMNPRKRIGWLMEEALLLHEKGMDAKQRKQRVREMLEEVGLDAEYAARYPGELSGGQRQRVSIALALLVKPAFIVADEPVSALDVSVQAQILNLLQELQQRHQLTYLFISHDLKVVAYLADRIGVMYLGYLVEEGTAEQILSDPRHPYTAALFSAGETVLSGEVPSPSDPPTGCPFHTRCQQCMEICRTEMPEDRLVESGHRVRCHLSKRPMSC